MGRLSKQNHYEQIIELIKQRILSGELNPGDVLPSTKELSEFYGVGRSTVREALSALKVMGLLEIRQGERCTVRKTEWSDLDFANWEFLLLDKKSKLELIEVRKTMEVTNAALASLRRTEDDLRDFRKILLKVNEKFTGSFTGSKEEIEKLAFDFHLTIAKATHNSILVHLFEMISTQMEKVIHEIGQLDEHVDKYISSAIWKEHREIYEAILKKDAVQAQKLMNRHLLNLEKIFK